MAVTCRDCWIIIFAWLLPPVAVFLDRGCGAQFAINCLLTLLAWIPGVVHAYCIVLDCSDEARLKNEIDSEIRANENRAGKTEPIVVNPNPPTAAAGTTAPISNPTTNLNSNDTATRI